MLTRLGARWPEFVARVTERQPGGGWARGRPPVAFLGAPAAVEQIDRYPRRRPPPRLLTGQVAPGGTPPSFVDDRTRVLGRSWCGPSLAGYRDVLDGEFTGPGPAGRPGRCVAGCPAATGVYAALTPRRTRPTEAATAPRTCTAPGPGRDGRGWPRSFAELGERGLRHPGDRPAIFGPPCADDPALRLDGRGRTAPPAARGPPSEAGPEVEAPPRWFRAGLPVQSWPGSSRLTGDTGAPARPVPIYMDGLAGPAAAPGNLLRPTPTARPDQAAAGTRRR